MKDLKCGLKECTFNKGYCCCSKSISVNGYSDCTTYNPDEKKRKTQFESASDFMPSNFSVDTKVDCSAKCIFNKDGKCQSNGITIMSKEPNDATCLTFIKS